MLLDSTLLFWHSGTTYAMTAGEYVSLATLTTSSASSVINLGNARDLGIGPGAEKPQVVVSIGTAVTSSLSTMSLSIQFQGSTNSTLWTTYIETPAATTASYAAGSLVVFDVPARPPGVSLPLYYRLNMAIVGNGTAGISTGTVLAGITLGPAQGVTGGQYPAGFSVV